MNAPIPGLDADAGGSSAGSMEGADAFAIAEPEGVKRLHLMVEGIHCGACVQRIETLLARQPEVISARVNMTSSRLVLRWRGAAEAADAILAPVEAAGYRLAAYDPERLEDAGRSEQASLQRALAVAGFGAANVMLFSVAIWSGADELTTRLFHWLSALVVLPTAAYAIRPFAAAAWAGLLHGRATMDLPIVIGVVLTLAASLAQTIRGEGHAYFEAPAMLLFFLLAGRVLERRARDRARDGVRQRLALGVRAVTMIGPGGRPVSVAPERVGPGARVLIAAGERIAVDGRIETGQSSLDSSLVTGETLPRAVGPGDQVHAGTINLAAPLTVVATATGEATLLAEIVRLMEAAEQGRSRYRALSERVSRWYAPLVHLLALVAFVFWNQIGGLGWNEALMIAVAVLVVTCPCALALAVPAVQVIASGRLARDGILLKSPTALERLAEIDRVVMDKTGTLTLGRPSLLRDGSWSEADLAEAAALAAGSRHPLSRALATAAGEPAASPGLREIPGQGMERDEPPVRLGSRRFCGIKGRTAAQGPELWFSRPNRAPVRFAFADAPRPDARHAVTALHHDGLPVELLSGDAEAPVATAALAAGIPEWRSSCLPAEKVAHLRALEEQGHRVLMVGDGLNDAPALAAAHASISPSTAADISQTMADAVFQGAALRPVLTLLDTARAADRLTRFNLTLALVYNAVSVPLALAGLVTPLFAAVAMSASSLLVVGNALRLPRMVDGRSWKACSS